MEEEVFSLIKKWGTVQSNDPKLSAEKHSDKHLRLPCIYEGGDNGAQENGWDKRTPQKSLALLSLKTVVGIRSDISLIPPNTTSSRMFNKKEQGSNVCSILSLEEGGYLR